MAWNFGPCKKRSARLELIDTPEITDRELSNCFDFIEKTERLINSHKIYLNYLKRCSQSWIKDQTITILDMYCGRGDLSRAILEWAKKKNWDIRILAVDRYGRIIHMAKEKNPHSSNLAYEVRDWNHASFLRAQQFDYVVSHLSLHHLSNDQIVSFLKTINLLAKRGFILSDWIRDIRGWTWIKGLSQLSNEEAVRSDGPQAVRRSLTPSELEKLTKEAGLAQISMKIYVNQRFSLISDRALVFSGKMNPETGLAGA